MTKPNPVHLVPTEAINPNSQTIDLMSTHEILSCINQEDAKISAVVANAIPSIVPVVDAIKTAFAADSRLFYVGAGTSGRLGVLDASECPPTFGVPDHWVVGIIAGGDHALRYAVEGAEDDSFQGEKDISAYQITAGDVVVGLSASGGAPYVQGALSHAKALGAVTACITCVSPSAITELVKYPIVLPVGPEVIAGSSRLKAGTAQKMVLNMLSTAAMIQSGRTYENIMIDVRPTNRKLRQRALAIVMKLAALSETAAETVLQESHWAVKPAVLMGRFNLCLTEAEEILARHDGKLRGALLEYQSK
ncbi:MAG: N-acetylmuramic acid 6-phosphate etherase [Cyanobacteria bacterium]|nr:N-acetylmuramic acid 6-phosphate etherase [Cyanobacteriota bacterium]